MSISWESWSAKVFSFLGKLSQYQSILCRFKAVHWTLTVSNLIFIRPQTDHSLALSLSDSQTNKLTPVYCVVNLIGVPLADDELEMPFQELLPKSRIGNQIRFFRFYPIFSDFYTFPDFPIPQLGFKTQTFINAPPARVN